MRSNKTFELVLTSLFVAIIAIMTVTPLGYIPLVVINATIIHIPVILGALFCGPKKGAFLGFVFGLTSFLKNTFMPTSLSAFVFSPVLATSVVGASGIFKSAYICFVPRILVGVLPYFIYVLVKKALTSKQKKVWTVVLNVLIGLFLFAGVRAFFNKMIEKICVENIASEAGKNEFLFILFEHPAWVTITALVVAIVITGVLIFISFKKNENVVAFTYAGVSGALVNTLLVMSSIFVLYKDAYAQALSVDASAVLGIIEGVISFNGVVEAIVAAVIVAGVGVVLNRIKPIEA